MTILGEEQDKLVQRFLKQLCEEKAAEMGVKPEDLMLKVVDGKYYWVKKAEILHQIEKQRQLVSPKQVVRSLRGGDQSLVGQIQKEVQTCRSLTDDMVNAKMMTVMERNDQLHSLTQIQRRVESITNQLMSFEDSIERAKARDPIYMEAETVLAQMSLAKKNGQEELVAQIQRTNRELLAKYENRRKTLGQHIESARQCRFNLQREQWRVFQLRWKLHGQSLKYLQKVLGGIGQSLPEGSIRREFDDEFPLLQQRLEELDGRHIALGNQTPPAQSDPNAGTQLWDKILPTLSIMIEERAYLQEALSSMIAKYSQHLTLTRDADSRITLTQGM